MLFHLSTIRIEWHRFAVRLKTRRPCPAPLPSPGLLPPPSLAPVASATAVALPVPLIRPRLSRQAQAVNYRSIIATGFHP